MSTFKAEVNNSFDHWFEEKICRPSLEYVPRSVAPNTISVINGVVCWLAFAALVLAPSLGPVERVLSLLAAAALTFASAVLDCWDGMQARRTGKTSKLGELLDHWLDAIHVPLVCGAIALTLELDAWMAILVHVSGAMIYNAQLVKYHLSGRFIHTPTSGVQAQFGAAIGMVLGGVVFLLFGRQTPWVQHLITLVALSSTYFQLKACRFYYALLPGQLAGHYPMVVHGLLLGGLYLMGAMSQLLFVLAVVFVSFRLSGSYVLHTIVKKPYRGNDWGIAAFIAAIAVAHFAAPALASEAVWALVAYCVARNFWDLGRHFEALRPSPEVAPTT